MSNSSSRLLSITGALSTWLDRVARAICIVFGVGILISINIAIFSRYVPLASLVWPEELARFLMIWIAFVGSSVAMKKVGLISFEFLVKTFTGKVRTIADIAIKIAVLVFLFFFLKYGVSELELARKWTALGTGMSYFWPALGPFVGGVIMAVHLLHGLLEDIFGVNVKSGNKGNAA